MLAVVDLPRGTRVTRSEYVRDPDTVATFEREFDLGDPLVGGSRLVSLEHDVSLYKTAAEAHLVTLAVVTVFNNAGSSSFRTFFAQNFQSGAGFKLTSLRVLRRRDLPVGSDSREITVRLGTPVGPFDASFAFVRVGRLVTSLYAVSIPNGRVSAGDVTRLAGRAVRRMQSVSRS
jgi:hypothetical protein